MKQEPKESFNNLVDVPVGLDLSSKNVMGSLVWRFVRTTASKLRQIKREQEERAKRSEPVYNIRYFESTKAHIKQVTKTVERRKLFRTAVSSIWQREKSIKRVFKQRQKIAALNQVEQQELKLRRFWFLNHQSLSFCRNMVQHIRRGHKDVRFNKLSRLTNRQLDSNISLVLCPHNLNRSGLLANVSRVTMYGYKWILGSEAFFHGRAARLLYTLRERRGILIKHFQVARGIWRKLPNWMGVLGRRKQLYGASRVLRVNPFDQRDGFRLLISSIYQNFKVLAKSSKMLKEDKRGVLRSLRFLRSSKFRGALQLSLRKLRTVKTKVLPINIVLISKRSNFYIIFGEQRGKMLIAISSGCIGFGKKRNRQRKGAGIKLASLCQKVLRFLKRKYKRIKITMVIHDSLRRNKTARTVFWNIQRDLVDRSFKRFRQFRRMYYGKWFRNILIETGGQLGKFDREQQAGFVDNYIAKLGGRSRYRVNWMRKMVQYKMVNKLARISKFGGIKIRKLYKLAEKQLGDRLKLALQDNIAGNWRKRIVRLAKSWYVRTYARPKFDLIKKFIWRSAAAEREYQRQRKSRFKKRYAKFVTGKGSVRKVKRNKFKKHVSSKKRAVN